jgi:hypothetical protein
MLHICKLATRVLKYTIYGNFGSCRGLKSMPKYSVTHDNWPGVMYNSCYHTHSYNMMSLTKVR